MGDEMKKNTEVKELIIDKTKELIRKNPNLTIKDIAEECYVNIAAVNYYFGSKDNLIAIAVKDIIDELKERVCEILKELDEDGIEDNLEKMINVLLRFTLENIGVVKHMFIHTDNLSNSSNLLLEAFFTENPFTKRIFEEIKKSSKSDDELIVKARYMLLFSCFSIPLFLQVADINDNSRFFSSFFDPEFFQKYIKELLRIIR
jgi:AcrR family transcriptional regulator